MNVTVRCNDLDCFANRCMHCRILAEPLGNKPCPFRKTEQEVREGRQKAIDRLVAIGRQDLIQEYTANAKQYAL